MELLRRPPPQGTRHPPQGTRHPHGHPPQGTRHPPQGTRLPPRTSTATRIAPAVCRQRPMHMYMPEEASGRARRSSRAVGGACMWSMLGAHARVPPQLFSFFCALIRLLVPKPFRKERMPPPSLEMGLTQSAIAPAASPRNRRGSGSEIVGRGGRCGEVRVRATDQEC